MNETLSRDDHLAPTLRSAELWATYRALSRVPEIAVVEAPRAVGPATVPASIAAALPAKPVWDGPPPSSSLLSAVAREVAAALVEIAWAAARSRTFWS
jgi:hypothetical protein